jgi:Zn-dependent alcohol dehydrogenase
VAGAKTIIGVDLLENKLDYAKEFGATHTINPGRQDLLKTVRGLTNGRGADYTFEVIGLSKTLAQAFACTQRGELVTRTYPLDEVNQAMRALERGEVIRSVVLM